MEISYTSDETNGSTIGERSFGHGKVIVANKQTPGGGWGAAVAPEAAAPTVPYSKKDRKWTMVTKLQISPTYYYQLLVQRTLPARQ